MLHGLKSENPIDFTLAQNIKTESSDFTACGKKLLMFPHRERAQVHNKFDIDFIDKLTNDDATPKSPLFAPHDISCALEFI